MSILYMYIYIYIYIHTYTSSIIKHHILKHHILELPKYEAFKERMDVLVATLKADHTYNIITSK